MSNFKRIVFIFAVIVIGLINILIYWNSHLYYRASERIENPENKIEAFERANRFYPYNDLVFYELGKEYFDLGIQNLQDKEVSETYLQKSIQNFTRSLRINPASYFCHFNLAQSLLYMNYLSPASDVNYYDEYKKAALLAGHNSQIYYEVGRILLSRWPSLSEEDREFTSEILRKILVREKPEELQSIMQIWEMSVSDYKVMEKILPEDPGVYRRFAKFLGEKNRSAEERRKFLAEAELMEFERAKNEYHSGENEFRYYRLKEAFSHFNAALRNLERINFYQNLAGEMRVNVGEFNKLKRSTYLNQAKCRLAEGRDFKEVEGILQNYLALENEIAAVNELEAYLMRQGFIEERSKIKLDDLNSLSFQMFLYFKQSQYRDIIKIGRLLRESFVVVPEEKRDSYMKVLRLVGDSLQKVDFLYDAGEFYQKALEIDPDNLETLLRIRQNHERLNNEEEVERINERIAKLLAPREMQLRNRIIHKGNKFSRGLDFDGRAIELKLHFKRDMKESGFVPMISVFFNGRVVWDDYLEDEEEEGVSEDEEREGKNKDYKVISISLKSKVGKNTIIVAPVNRSIILRRITYRFTD